MSWLLATSCAGYAALALLTLRRWRQTVDAWIASIAEYEIELRSRAEPRTAVSSQALNLAAIDAAVRQHAGRCEGELVAIRMAPFEVDRLSWEDFDGIPIEADRRMPTGRVRLVCDLEDDTNDEPALDRVLREPVPAGGER